MRLPGWFPPLTRAMPGSAGRSRDSRNRTYPHFGTNTSAWFRFRRRAVTSRITNPCVPRFDRYDGFPAGFGGSKNAAWPGRNPAGC